MSNIPPLLSDSPPPMVTPDDEEDDFGEFNSAVDIPYAYENLSLPSTPQHVPLEDISKIENFDINSNTDNIKDIKYKNHINGLFSLHIDKDFQDKRKSCDISMALSETDVNLPKNQCKEIVNNVNSYKNDVLCCNGDYKEERINSENVDGVLPNESVPIDTSIHSYLPAADLNEENNIVPDFAGGLDLEKHENLHNFTNTCENVPCFNENVLDTSKDNSKNISMLQDDSLNNINNDRSNYNSNSDSVNIVPNDCGANNEKNEGEKTEQVKEKFYFGEEPPDLHVVDDSKVQVEDFNYYDAYDNEQDLEKEYPEMVDKFYEINELNDGYKAEISNDHVEIAVQKFKKSDRLDDNSRSKNENQNEKCSEISDEILANGKSHYDVSILKSISSTYETAPENKQIHYENDAFDCKTSVNEIESCTLNNTSNNVSILSHGNLENNHEEINQEIEIDDELDIIAVKEKEITVSKNYDKFKDEKDTFRDINKFDQDEVAKAMIIESNDIKFDDTNNGYSEFSDFVDFAKFDDQKFTENSTIAPCIEETKQNLKEFSSSQQNTIENNLSGDEEDEFGDFGDYTQSNANNIETSGHTTMSTASIVKLNRENILENVERIILEMYPVCEVTCDEFVLVNVLETDLVFKSIKDVTETDALTYQWTKSTCQDKMLNALNIDTRNILYGTGWNPMMPKYAANLGLTPLEPVKSADILASSSGSNTAANTVQSSPPAITQVDIPSAQFDWSDSGLINPLDCTQGNTILLDLEQLVASLELSHTTISTTQPPSSSDEFDEWEYWLKCHSKSSPQRITDQDNNMDIMEKSTDNLTPVFRARFHSDNESVKSLQLTTDAIPDPEEASNKQEQNTANFEDDSFNEFTSYQSQKPPPEFPQLSNSTIPLRETHIFTNQTSNERKNEKAVVDWKKTLDAPRKNGQEENDEFTDFQMSLPNPKGPDRNKTSVGDFSVCNGSSVLQPVLEPLKPMVLGKEMKEQPQINWPNPGITDDDILNIELSYSRKEQSLDVVKTKENSAEITKTEKQNVWNNVERKASVSSGFPNLLQVNKGKEKSQIADDKSKVFGLWEVPNKVVATNDDDDDDWTDFVCNPEPMKSSVQPKSIISQSERTQTSELRLSVPRLSQIQQPKKPIPVITPQGLIQTRIPSNASNLSNMNIQQPSSLSQNQIRHNFQPSIISHQYQSHINGSPFVKPNVNGFYNGLIPQQVQINQSLANTNPYKPSKADDDDDWTDFISSPPVQTTKKPTNTHVTGISRTNAVNYGIATPNIITNPVHFDYNLHASRTNGGSHARKPPNFNTAGVIPSISALPDLDFVAPKSRGFSKK